MAQIINKRKKRTWFFFDGVIILELLTILQLTADAGSAERRTVFNKKKQLKAGQCEVI